MVDSNEIALCLNCVDDLTNKTYTVEEFFCIPLTELTRYYEWPTLEEEVERFSKLHVSLNLSHKKSQQWIQSHFAPHLPSRRQKFCVALSGISKQSGHNLYLLRPDELLCEQSPFFTIVCVNLSLRLSNKKLSATPHFHLHAHVVKMASLNDDGNETRDALDALASIDAVSRSLHYDVENGKTSATKKRPAAPKLAPRKDIRMDDGPPQKKAKSTPTARAPVIAKGKDVVNDAVEQPTAFIRYQRGDNEPIFFDIGGANTSSFELHIQCPKPDSDDCLLTVNINRV